MAGQQTARPDFHARREGVSDLEVAGMVKDVPPGESRFVSLEWIERLPRITMRMRQSEDFSNLPKAGVSVTGVALNVLARSLGAETNSSVIEAICKDGYTASYSRDYLRRHRPVVVLTIDGLSLHAWAVKNHQYDASPYLIGFEGFAPAFHVLSHTDKPLEPSELIKLRFDPAQQVDSEIRPKSGSGKVDTAVTQGYLIARQSCFRCHNAGVYGGTKAGKDWRDLGEIAKSKPEWFAKWVHDPRSIDPKSRMPPNLEYDKATLDALTKYFATFAVEGQ